VFAAAALFVFNIAFGFIIAGIEMKPLLFILKFVNYGK
jgi:hypothetical protein